MIKDAVVIDPREEGEVAHPFLWLTLESAPEQRGKRYNIVSPPMIVTQCGPLWTVLIREARLHDDHEVAGIVNSRTRTKIIPVEVEWTSEGVSNQESMFLNLSRARTLAKRLGWQYILSDTGAQRGLIQWDLDRKMSICVGRPYCRCENEVTETVILNGVRMPACKYHLPTIRGMAANLRLQRSK